MVFYFGRSNAAEFQTDTGPVPKQFIILGAGFTTRNMGVWALASGAIHTISHTYPSAKIFLIDYHKSPAEYEVYGPDRKTVHVELINIRFSKQVWHPNNIALLLAFAIGSLLIPNNPIRRRLLSRNRVLKHFVNADYICSIAGGDSFSDIYGLRRLVYVALPQILSLFLHKRLVLMPQTIGPFKRRLGRHIGRFILRGATKIYSRDTEGLKEVRDLVPDRQSPASRCYDLGFILEPAIAPSRIPESLLNMDASRPLIGVNVSGLLYIGGYTGDNMFGLKVNYPELMKSLVLHFINAHGAHALLIPHVLGDESNRESDVIACQRLFHDIQGNSGNFLHLLDEPYDHQEMKALIGRCTFFLGSRMHACIAALSQCIPAIGLAYSRKFQGVYAPIGMEELVLDLRNLNDSEILDLADGLFLRKGQFRTVLEEKIPDVQEKIMKLCRDF